MPLFAIPFPAIDPVAISLGPFAIRWYALAYIVGLLIGWRYCLALAGRPPHFVERRAVRAAERCRLGHDLPLWRPGAASSEPALRSVLRGHPPVPAAVCSRAPECPAAPRARYGIVSRGLRGCPHVGRTLPGAGPTAWF